MSYAVPVLKAQIVGWINNKKYWQPAVDQNGKERNDAWVSNARDEPLPACRTPAPRCSGDLAGYGRTPRHGLPHELTALARLALDARHAAPGRFEYWIKTLKNTGFGKVPFFDFHAHQA